MLTHSTHIPHTPLTTISKTKNPTHIPVTIKLNTIQPVVTKININTSQLIQTPININTHEQFKTVPLLQEPTLLP